MSHTDLSVREAYAYCSALARKHYENFPVASLFLPRERRPDIAAIYAFARLADDMADEGSMPPEERLQQLDAWGRQLDDCYEGKAGHPVFIALRETVARRKIPRKPLADLLAAFRMDVTTSRYRTFDDVLGYCRLSANPVGQLVLYVFEDAGETNLRYSDSICTALQLANFWQDVSVDRQKGRIYIPLEDFGHFDYTEEEFHHDVENERFRELIRFQVERTRRLFADGEPLLRRASRELRFELALTWHGGMAILRKIEESGYRVLSGRQHLTWLDKLAIVRAALRKH